MNMYFVFDDGRIVTPAHGGTILEGITRASIIELAGKLGHQVEERKFSIDEWRDGVTSGRITEVFACGTAAVVTPVGTLKWDGGEAARLHRRRPGHPAAAQRAGRHPVRPRRGHVRVDAPDRVTRRAGRLPALVGAGALVLAACSTPDTGSGSGPRAPRRARPRPVPPPAPDREPHRPGRAHLRHEDAGAAARRRRAGLPRRAPARGRLGRRRRRGAAPAPPGCRPERPGRHPAERLPDRDQRGAPRAARAGAAPRRGRRLARQLRGHRADPRRRARPRAGRRPAARHARSRSTT